jgi:hypothetical protein
MYAKAVPTRWPRDTPVDPIIQVLGDEVTTRAELVSAAMMFYGTTGNCSKPGSDGYKTGLVLLSCQDPFDNSCVSVAFLLDLAILRVIIKFGGDFFFVNGVRHITEDYLVL